MKTVTTEKPAADPHAEGPFLWGAATAAFQIEGAASADGRGLSNWDEFLRRTGKHDDGRVACDHYRRWRDDVNLMSELGLQAYRFSLSWPRIMPVGRGKVNPKGLDFYDRLIDALMDARIAPFVTLFHWDLPLALETELAGWACDDLPKIFADYADVVFERLGDRVRHWLTINEPWVMVDAGYFHGTHPPGLKDRAQGYRAGHNMLRGHAYAVERFRASRAAAGKISFALNTSYSFPATELPEDRSAAERAMLDFAGWFTDPPHFGDYPAELRERHGALLPAFSAADSRLLARSMDFLALNYYTSDVVRHASGAGAMEIDRAYDTHSPRTEMGWPIVPEGFRRLLHWLHDRYGGLDIFVTENGAALADRPDEDGNVDDADRIAYLREHIAAMQAAQRGGVRVGGYFVWSLLDNLEWAEGFSKRFGIVRCDHTTQRRTIKRSGRWYRELIALAGRIE